MLLGAGANMEARDELGCTPLYHAAVNLSREALPSLLKHGATANTQGDSLNTPLMMAAAFAGRQGGAAGLVECLLRAGADETIVNNDGNRAVEELGNEVEEEADRLAEDVERVRELLAIAPADRSWRHRGYLVLCRARPHRVQQGHMMISGTHRIDTARGTRTCAELTRSAGSRGTARWMRVPMATGLMWCRRCFCCRRRAYSGES